jgi:hypothetical protein
VAVVVDGEVTFHGSGGRRIVSVLIARSLKPLKHNLRWQVEPHPLERKYLTLVARLTEDNGAFLDFHVFSHIDRKARFPISPTDAWLKTGRKLDGLEHFCDAVEKLVRRRADIP